MRTNLFGHTNTRTFNRNRFWRRRRFLPHRSFPQLLMLLWSGFFSIAIGYFVFERLHVFADAPLPPSHLVAVNDDLTSTIKWNPSPDSDTVGYKVIWGEENGQPRVLFTSYPDIQLEPLDENKTYEVKVQSVNKNGILSTTVGPVRFKSDSSYVKALSEQMDGMFDDFNDNSFNGLPNPLHWYTTIQNASSISMAFVSGVEHDLGVFLQNSSNNENQTASATMRSLVPFDFTNQIGTLSFDSDYGQRSLIAGTKEGGNTWSLTISPTLVDAITYDTSYNGTKVIFPLEAFQVYVDGDIISLRKIENGVVVNHWDSTYSRIHPIRDINIRKHSVLKISKDTASLFIDGQEIVTASNIDLGFSKGWVYNEQRIDGLTALHVPYALSYFDNIGFDSANTNALPVIHTYTAGGYGESDRKTLDFFSNSVSYSITIPDTLAGEQAERLLIDANVQGTAIPKITVNGVSVVWPQTVGIEDGGSFNTRVISLPVGTLHTGINTIAVSASDTKTFSISMENIHAEVEFPHGTGIIYTPYAVPFSGNNVETKIPPVAPIATLGDNSPLDKAVVQGTIPVEVVADGNFSLYPTGHVNAVTQVELDIDGVPQSLQTLPGPTVKTDQILQFDTTKVPNGQHTVTVTAYGTDKNLAGKIVSLNSFDPLLSQGLGDNNTLLRRVIVVNNGTIQPTTAPTLVMNQTNKQTTNISPVPSSSPASESGILGNTTIGTISDRDEGNHVTGSRFVTGDRAGETENMSVYVGTVDDASHSAYQMAIYSDNGGKPGRMIASTAVGSLTSHAWNTLPITATLASHTPYWLVYSTNAGNSSANSMMYTTDSTSGISALSPFGSFPQTIFGYASGTWNFSIYVTFTSAIFH